MHRVRVSLALGLLLSAAPALAQDAPPPPASFEGSTEFSFVGTTGNASTRTIGAGTTLTFRPDSWTVVSKISFVRTEDRNTTKAQSLGLTTETDHALTTKINLFGRHEYRRDRFAGIDHRNALQGGVAIDAIEDTRQQLKLKAGVGYANEQRVTGADLSTAIGTAGFVYKLKLSATASFENEARSELSLQSGSDQRISNVASLSAALNSTLSMKLKHTTRWVKTPPPGFGKTDTITAIALVAKF